MACDAYIALRSLRRRPGVTMDEEAIGLRRRLREAHPDLLTRYLDDVGA